MSKVITVQDGNLELTAAGTDVIGDNVNIATKNSIIGKKANRNVIPIFFNDNGWFGLLHFFIFVCWFGVD